MRALIAVFASILLASPVAFAEEPAGKGSEESAPAADEAPDGPVTMSGMSILGNEETPKALVIVPWKSSELGDDPGLSGMLEDLARPVDKEVFMRELEYYELRSGK